MKMVLSLGLAAWTCLAQATGLQSLEQFVAQVRAGQASFTQSVTSPPKAGAVARVKTSRGTFAFERPGRFRFDYNRPFAQSMVADGKTLWMVDPDLNQVTARNQASALGHTPAALIASSTDLSELRQQFVLSDVPDEEGLQWVQAVPVRADGTVRSVRLGFASAASSSTPPLLAVLEIEDSFGQRSVMRFEQFQVKASLPPETFRFTPPPGADLVRQ